MAVNPASSWSNDTPLTLACSAGHCEVVRVLHDAGADLKQGRSDGKPESTPFALAYRQGRRDVVEYLRSCGADCTLGRGRPKEGYERAISSPPPSPLTKQRRPKRTTPIQERAERAGVSGKLMRTPPGLRELIATGSPSSSPVKTAKKQLHMTQKANQQIVARAEVQVPRNADKKQALNDGEATSKRAKRRSSHEAM